MDWLDLRLLNKYVMLFLFGYCIGYSVFYLIKDRREKSLRFFLIFMLGLGLYVREYGWTI